MCLALTDIAYLVGNNTRPAVQLALSVVEVSVCADVSGLVCIAPVTLLLALATAHIYYCGCVGELRQDFLDALPISIALQRSWLIEMIVNLGLGAILVLRNEIEVGNYRVF